MSRVTLLPSSPSAGQEFSDVFYGGRRRGNTFEVGQSGVDLLHVRVVQLMSEIGFAERAPIPNKRAIDLCGPGGCLVEVLEQLVRDRRSECGGSGRLVKQDAGSHDSEGYGFD